MEISKITAIAPKIDQMGNHETWTNPQYNTTYYKFQVTLSNGKSGTINSKSPQSRYNIGDDVIAEYNQHGYVSKLQRPQNNQPAGNQYSGVSAQKDPFFDRSVCYKYACDFGGQRNLDKESTFKLAEYFYRVMMSYNDKQKIKMFSIALSYSILYNKNNTGKKSAEIVNDAKEIFHRITTDPVNLSQPETQSQQYQQPPAQAPVQQSVAQAVVPQNNPAATTVTNPNTDWMTDAVVDDNDDLPF